MAKNNAFLNKLRETRDKYIQATCNVYCQYVADIATIVMHDVFGFGPKRCKEFWDKLREYMVAFDCALGSRTKEEALTGETEYLREKLDQKLKEALGPYYEHDFEERYPDVYEVRYK